MLHTGERLKKRREEERYTRAQLAEMTGLSYDTIRSIELGRRTGSADAWEAINAVLDKGPSLSFDCDELIQEVLADIHDLGPEYPCILYYKKQGDLFIFHDYALEEDLNPGDDILEDEFLRLKYSKKELKEAFDLKPGEVQIESTLQKAYEIFEYQNRILK